MVPKKIKISAATRPTDDFQEYRSISDCSGDDEILRNEEIINIKSKEDSDNYYPIFDNESDCVNIKANDLDVRDKYRGKKRCKMKRNKKSTIDNSDSSTDCANVKITNDDDRINSDNQHDRSNIAAESVLLPGQCRDTYKFIEKNCFTTWSHNKVNSKGKF